MFSRHNALKEPIAQRRRKLEDSLRWHQFNFDADIELNWIKEHIPTATSTEYGKNLVDAKHLTANHKVDHYILDITVCVCVCVRVCVNTMYLYE